MSSKYSEKNVLKIKQDIQRASEELRLINLEKEEALRGRGENGKPLGLEKLQEILINERKSHNEKVSNIWLQAANDLKSIQHTRHVFEKEIQSLKSEKSLLSYQINILTDLLNETIQKITNEKSNLSFIPNLIEESKKILSFLSKKKIDEQNSIKIIQEEKEKLEGGLSNLKKFEDEYRDKIENLEKIILENTEKISSLLKERDTIQVTVDEMKRRDYDSRILAQRLTKEYQEVYFNRKK